MIDVDLIKKSYARMSDEKLISVLKTDGSSITYEAFIILKREYIKRRLNPDNINEIERLRQEQTKEKVRNNFEREEYIINNKLWKGILSKKATGKNDKEIIEWLINEGIQPENALEGLKKIEEVTISSYKRARNAMALSILLIFGGMILFGVGITGSLNISFAIYGALLTITPLKFI